MPCPLWQTWYHVVSYLEKFEAIRGALVSGGRIMVHKPADCGGGRSITTRIRGMSRRSSLIVMAAAKSPMMPVSEGLGKFLLRRHRQRFPPMFLFIPSMGAGSDSADDIGSNLRRRTCRVGDRGQPGFAYTCHQRRRY
ncbi:hypothetical protein [Rhodopila sp.]|uniref:hypothetical protein n=1 Tax=Rhodopila sp. TaxID=2480087 RepID=UPI003D1198D6